MAVLNPSSPAAAQLVYATYLGEGFSYGTGIAVDSSGNAYITGVTETSNFPTTAGAFQTKYPRGANDEAFVTKISPSAAGSASLIYSTYLSVNTAGNGIAVDGFGNAYVTGFTQSPSFPTTANAIQKSFGKATDVAFVTTLNASGSALLLSTYLGGTDTANETIGEGIALDGTGNIDVAGEVGSSGGNHPVNFLTTPGLPDELQGRQLGRLCCQALPGSQCRGRAVRGSREQAVRRIRCEPAKPGEHCRKHRPDTDHPGWSGTAADGVPSVGARRERVGSPGQLQPSDTGTAIPSLRPWPMGKRSAAEIRDCMFAEMGTEPDPDVLTTYLLN